MARNRLDISHLPRNITAYRLYNLSRYATLSPTEETDNESRLEVSQVICSLSYSVIAPKHGGFFPDEPTVMTSVDKIMACRRANPSSAGIMLYREPLAHSLSPSDIIKFWGAFWARLHELTILWLEDLEVRRHQNQHMS